MKKIYKNIIEFILVFFILVSTFPFNLIKVEAKQESYINKEKIREEISQAYKDKIKNSSKKIYENKNQINKSINPEEKVRIIVQTDEKALKDFVSKYKPLEAISKDKNLVKKVDDSRIKIKRKVKMANPDVKLRKDYGVLLNGFSAEVKYKDIEKIKQIPGVKHVSLAKKHYKNINKAKDLTGVNNVLKNSKYHGEKMAVSIIDSGIEPSHKDMRISKKENIKLEKDFINSIKDGKGSWYTDKIPYGYNYADDNDEIFDRTETMHGMHVSGIVGANCENEEEILKNQGVKGVAPECQLLAMKVFSNEPENISCYDDDVIAAIEDSVIYNADVINMSLGSPCGFIDSEDAQQKAIKEAVDRGIVVVTAQGNSYNSTFPFSYYNVSDNGVTDAPGCCLDALSVAALNNDENLSMCDYSSFGPTSDLEFKPEISAPGEDIVSTVNNGYENMGGTSMAAPHVSGAMCLIMQYLNDLCKEEKINLSPREKVEVAKKLAVNTAKVVLDKQSSQEKIPYSPRKQGAGIIDVEAALKNKVTAEYKEDKRPVVALKEIESKKTFNIKLHNYGKDSVTYKVDSICDEVLTQKCKNKKDIDDGMQDINVFNGDEKIKGSKVNVNEDTITINGGEDAQVSVTLTIPEDTKKNIFAEGFIRFIPLNNKEDKTPEIGIPFMGFYGKWDHMPNIDAPIWEKDKTLFEGTSLLTLSENNDYAYLGLHENRNNSYIDKESIAITSNSLGNKVVIPGLWPLRNIKDMEVKILNSDKKEIRTVAKDNNISKKIYIETDKPLEIRKNWLWDGTVFDRNKNQYVSVPEGEYYIRVLSKIDYKDAGYENLDMKVKMDNTAPKVEIISNEYEERIDNNYTLKFKAEDVGKVQSGVMGFTFIINGEIYRDDSGNCIFNKIEKDENGVYEIDLKLPKDNNDIRVVAIDFAGNQSDIEGKVYKKTCDISLIKDSKLQDPMCLLDGNFDLNIKIKNNFKNYVDKIRIFLDDEIYKDIELDKNKENINVEFNNILGGRHEIKVQCINIEKNIEEIIGEEFIQIQIQEESLKINLDPESQGDMTNKNKFILKGRLSALPNEFKIQNKDVIMEGLNFKHEVNLEENKLNKIPIYIRKNDEIIKFSKNIYCDTMPPKIDLNLTCDVVEKEDEIIVNVPSDMEKYKLKGSVADNMFGYTFYINGEADKTIDLSSTKDTNVNTFYAFEKEIPLICQNTELVLKAVDVFGNTTIKKIKIIKNQNELKEFKIEPYNVKDEYRNGDQFNGGVRVTNDSKKTQLCTLIVGVFDENNQMVNVILNSQAIDPGKEVDLKAVFTIPESGKNTIRCFMWDSIYSMVPLTEVIKIPVVPKNM